MVAETGQVELAHDALRQQANHVGGGGHPVARPGLLGDGRPADEVPALEDDAPQPRARQVGGAHEPVVAAANDHGVVGTGAAHLYSL